LASSGVPEKSARRVRDLEPHKSEEERQANRPRGRLSGLPFRRHGRAASKRRDFAGPIIIACALVAVLVAADFWLNSGKVHRGVEVGNVS
jgi:hypothetical protein